MFEKEKNKVENDNSKIIIHTFLNNIIYIYIILSYEYKNNLQ